MFLQININQADQKSLRLEFEPTNGFYASQNNEIIVEKVTFFTGLYEIFCIGL